MWLTCKSMYELVTHQGQCIHRIQQSWKLFHSFGTSSWPIFPCKSFATYESIYCLFPHKSSLAILWSFPCKNTTDYCFVVSSQMTKTINIFNSRFGFNFISKKFKSYHFCTCIWIYTKLKKIYFIYYNVLYILKLTHNIIESEGK